jgi:hypothetical protein
MADQIILANVLSAVGRQERDFRCTNSVAFVLVTLQSSGEEAFWGWMVHVTQGTLHWAPGGF